MNLPFTTEQFLSVFEQYNQAIWPFQIFLNLLAIVAIIISAKKYYLSDKIIIGILAFLWVWIGIVYHLSFFATINPAAKIFGALTIIQGFIFLYFGIYKGRLIFQYPKNMYGFIGSLMILYALLIYPIAGYFLGHIYPKAPTFGLPCPTTIFTFGILLWTSKDVPQVILIIPFLWSLVGFSAALTMGIIEDTGLLVAGLTSTIMILVRNKKA